MTAAPNLGRIIWIMPAAFALHIAEEYVGGFPAWVTNVLGGSFNNVGFVVNNAIFMAVMLILTVWTSKTQSRLAAFLLIAWASGKHFFWDALVSTCFYDGSSWTAIPLA